MRFNNYLLDLKDNFNQINKRDICVYGVSPIIKSVYLDLKKCYKKQLIKTIYNEFGIPYNTVYSWIVGQNPIPISKAYCLLFLKIGRK